MDYLQEIIVRGINVSQEDSLGSTRGISPKPYTRGPPYAAISFVFAYYFTYEFL